MTNTERNKKYYEKVKNTPEFKAKRLKWQRSWRKRNKQKARLLNRNWARKNPDKVKNAALLLRFNITLEDYNVLFRKQSGKCAICEIDANKLTRNLAVDHCHRTNQIRGLLCMKCNRALGNLNDDINLLKRAMEYLLYD